MATTINSGYANSPKLTANIADHADVFGGRSLVFDGIVDQLEISDSSNLDLTNFTLSAWIKLTDVSDFRGIISKRSGTDVNYSFFVTTSSGHDGKLGSFDGSSEIVSNSTVNDGSWHNVVQVHNSGTTTFYIDGSSDGGGSQSFSTNSHSVLIGEAGVNQNDKFLGSMCDVKIFNTALTEAQVTELYRKPENTPSAVQDNLIAWYPMIEGNPESPQSIVYDHSEKKLGSEISGDPTFDNASNWTISLGNGGVDVNTTTAGKLTVANAQDTRFQKSSILTVGKLYKVTFVIDSYSSGRVRGLFDTDITFTPTGAGTYTRYFVASNTYFLVSFDGTANMTMTDISIKEVLMGNHATTNFFGDEIVNDPSFDTALANGQTNANFKLSGDGSITGGAFAFTAGSGVGRITIMDDASTETTFANTKTYQVQFTISSSGNALLNFDWANGGYVNYGNGSHTLTAVGDGSNLQMQASPSGNDFSITDISIKEVGVSSSGFETAVNEPVVPQVPLMRYNQKMYFDGVDDRLNPSAPDLLVSGDWSISAWFVTDSISADQFIMAQTQSANNRIGIHINTSGNIIATMWDGSSYYQKSSTAISVGTMNHVVYANSNKTITLYLNGVAQSGSLSEGLESTTGTTIGCKTGNSMFFNGIIEDMSFFNHTMTSTAAQELFNDGVAYDATTHSKASALRAYWRNDGVTTWKNRGDKFASFDGVDDVITRNAINVDYKSVSFWMRPSTTATSASSFYPVMTFFNWGYSAVAIGNATSAFTNELIMIQESSGGTKKTAFIPSEGETIPNDSWTHIAFIWNGSNYDIYFNGVKKSVVANTEETNGGHVPLSTNNTLRFGHGGASGGTFYNGDLTGIAIWSESLTDAQVLSIYNAGQNGNIASIQSSDLELYYTFDPHASTDADTNASVQDRSGNDRDSTSVSGAVIDRDGTVSGSPDFITIREALNSNRDGLGFYFKNPSSNVLRLNGVDEYIEVPVSKGLQSQSALTLEAWIKCNSKSTAGAIIAKDDTTNRVFNLTVLESSSGSANKVIFNIYSGGSAQSVTSTSVVADGNWHHIAGTFEPSTKQVIYVDGVAETTDTSSIPNSIDLSTDEASTPIRIGSFENNALYFEGLLDEIKLYNRALSASEVLKNYKHQKGKHKND
jgi:hypothetical protein